MWGHVRVDMDRLREPLDFGGDGDIDSEGGWTDVDAGSPADADCHGPAEDPPMLGGDERRMQVRAYHFWARLLGDHNFPHIEDLDPAAQSDFSANSVLLDFRGGIERPLIGYLGAALAQECGAGPIRTLADVPPRSLLSRITDHYLQIIANRAPIGFEAEFVNGQGATIMYRGILLPFSSDGAAIDFIYGVINWKEVANEALTGELQLEVAAAIAAAAAQPATPPTPIWADGPDASLDQPTDLGDSPDHGDDWETVPSETDGLADWVASARRLVDAAEDSEGRSRAGLYRAIGRAYDVAVIATRDMAGLAEMLDDAGIRMQARAPMTAIAKLVFGVTYDKTRLTEYATAMAAAAEARLELGAMTDWLGQQPGGLKGVVKAAREARRAARPATQRPDPRAGLRRAAEVPLAALRAGSEEFVLLVARATGDGGLAVVARAEADPRLLERAMRAARPAG